MKAKIEWQKFWMKNSRGGVGCGCGWQGRIVQPFFFVMPSIKPTHVKMVDIYCYIYVCSELHCIRQYSGSFGLFCWTLVSFGNLVPTKSTSQRDFKLVPSRVQDCQSPKNTVVILIYYSVAFIIHCLLI